MIKLMMTALLTLPTSSWSGETGEHIHFRGKSLAPMVSAKAGGKAGDVLWASPDSDKLKHSFSKVFFQGVIQNPDIQIQAAVGDGKNWGPWVDARLRAQANGRFWAKIEIAGKPGDRVKLRALTKTGAAANAQLFDLEAAQDEEEAGGAGGGVRLMPDSLGEPPAAAPPPQTAQPEQPEVHPRKQWGAKKAKKPYEPMVPDRITVHHTEGFQAFTKEDAIQEMRVIQDFHQTGRGWIDIGYHYLIDGSGGIWEGRPVGVVGAHVKDKNDGNVGISLMGDFHAPKNERPSIAQVQSLVVVLKWLSAKYTIAPDRIKGHRDQNETSCPGDILYAMLPDIRRRVSTGSVAFRLPSAARIQLAFEQTGAVSPK
ncbi:MAG: N-acetylmuramoyl-L-alanine amidase [Elusimicrobia bacterium]|nr:N-acetylmuramoyl-L-alanine amidase [Elusimicrobiota bacterium]